MIKLYTTHCPQCKVLETKLNSANIRYEVCDDLNVMLEKNFKAAPILDVDGNIYNFKDAIKWVNAQ